jgi:DNA-binding CsgD family transcriptional regulator
MMLAECRRVGVYSIIVTPFQDREGRAHIVSISRRRDERPEPRRVPILQAVCAQTWWRLGEIVDGSLTGEAQPIALTARELEILKWIKSGKNNAEISEVMNLAVKTIEFHLGNIFRKLGAGNRTTAVVIAIRNKLLEL